MTKLPSPKTASLVVLPNVLCRQQNRDRYHNDQCGHLRPKIIGEAAFVARLRIHMGLRPSGIIVPEALWELTRSRLHRCFATCYRSLDTEFFDLRIKHQLFTCDQRNVQEAPAAPIKSLPWNALNKAMSFEKSGPNSRKIISLAYQQGAVAREIAGSLVRHVRPPIQHRVLQAFATALSLLNAQRTSDAASDVDARLWVCIRFIDPCIFSSSCVDLHAGRAAQRDLEISP